MQRNGMERNRIVLVRHAKSIVEPARQPSEWGLADDQDAAVGAIADGLRNLGIDRILTSTEPKARGTGAILQRSLDVPLGEDEAFREQGLDAIPWISEPEGFVAAVRDHFERPDELVFGDESSRMAATRFAAGVRYAMETSRFPVIVTHGRVMCGYLRDAIGIDPMDIWPTLRMPDAFVVDLETKTLERISEGA